MGISHETVRRNLPPGVELFPGENTEFFEKSSTIKLFEATVDGGFTECGGDIGGGEFYNNFMDVANESTVLITNFRICYQPLRNYSKLSSSSLSSLADTYHPRAIQIPHLSISQIDESQNQITISMKFSPLKYLFKFSKKQNYNPNHHRAASNSLCHDFSYTLKKFINPNSIENVFAFRMGEHEIGKEKDCRKKKRELTKEEKLYKELFDTNTSEEEDDDDAIRKGLDENKCKRVRKLGWAKGYKIQKEFERMQMSKDSWSIVSYNDDFSLSPTYAKDFILPSRILKKNATFACESFDTSDSYEVSTTAFQSSSEFFEKLVNFRKNGRFPLICWKKGHHVLMRSGQPMVSILGWRGVEDELLIKEVLRAISEEQQQILVTYHNKNNINGGGNDKHDKLNRKRFQEKCSNTKLCILDARNFSSAFSNGFARGGYEKCENYPNTSLEFLGLPNIHSISNSHSALLNAISTYSSSPKWFSVLESTGWLGHVADLLKAAGGKDGVVGKIVEEDSSVLVHCTDGWDRTTQLVSLAQIMLDPFYRTIKGFQILIEKEWIASGHPFRARSELPKNLNPTIPPTQEDSPNCQKPIPVPPASAPIFLLFLTCVHHLLQQFPSEFEYNDFFLLCLARAAAGNSPYGDFLCNSDCEREFVRLRERTKSIWTWVREHKPWFRNTGYYPKRTHDRSKGVSFDKKWKKEVLKPDTGARLITLWTEYYFPKDDFSVTLLSTPLGCEIPFPTEFASNSRPYHISEFVLIKMLMKRRERRIAEKVWRVWRSFVLEKKGKLKINNEIRNGENGENGENEEADFDLMGSSVWQDSNLLPDKNLLTENTGTDKQVKDSVEDSTESKFLLIIPPEKSVLDDNRQNYLSVSSPTNLSPSVYLTVTPSELLPAKEDYFSEEEQLKPVYPVIEEGEENNSSQQQWVYLCRQHQKIDDDSNDLSQTLAELLKEAQSDEYYMSKSKCQDSKALADLLKEAQLDNSSFPKANVTRQRKSKSTNVTVTQKIARTSSSSPSRSCRSSNEINSNIIENSPPDLDFVIV